MAFSAPSVEGGKCRADALRTSDETRRRHRRRWRACYATQRVSKATRAVDARLGRAAGGNLLEGGRHSRREDRGGPAPFRSDRSGRGTRKGVAASAHFGKDTSGCKECAGMGTRLATILLFA